ncbi:hypothetical protein ACMFMG_010600 [Clarireedia jacksonii]
MDPLSFTASIISVGTLAVQCADSLRKASAFWSSIQDAPKDIDRLSQESSLLANIFDDIERDFNLGQIPSQMHDNYVIVMRLAQEDLKELTDLVDKLSDKLASSTSAIKQHWAKLQIALKDEKISKMRKKLQRVESMIHTLELRSLKVCTYVVNKLQISISIYYVFPSFAEESCIEIRGSVFASEHPDNFHYASIAVVIQVGNLNCS